MSIPKGLIDNRNQKLFEELSENFDIKVEVKNSLTEYGCYSINKTSTIYVPSNNICSASFTHELLHILIRNKKIYLGATIKRQVQELKHLSRLYSPALLERISNCLDHIKMLPIYMNLGFDKSKFILDFEVNKCTTQEILDIKSNWKIGLNYNTKAVDFYLGKFYAIHACPNDRWKYKEKLNELESINKQLFQINTKLVERWTKMDMESEDILEDDYIIIGGDYIQEMAAWVRNKSFK